MKTNLLLLSLIFTLPFNGQSAPSSSDTTKHTMPAHPFCIGASFGAGVPIVENGSTGATNFSRQFAYVAPGKYVDVSFNYQISKHFGIMFEANTTIEVLGKSFTEPTYSLQTNGGTYSSTQALIGPFYSLSYKNRIVFESRLLIGLTNFYQTPISGTEYYTSDSWPNNWPTPPTPFTIPAYKSLGPCAELGVKLKIHVVKGFYITTNFAYTQSFTGGYYYYYQTFDEVPFFPPQPMALISTSLGVEFKF